MNQIEMLDIARRRQSELRQLAGVNRPLVTPEPPEVGLDAGPGSLGLRLRQVWQASLRPLRQGVGGPP